MKAAGEKSPIFSVPWGHFCFLPAFPFIHTHATHSPGMGLAWYLYGSSVAVDDAPWRMRTETQREGEGEGEREREREREGGEKAGQRQHTK